MINKKNDMASSTNIIGGLNVPIPLYTAKQVYEIEKEWFDNGYISYGLMQQAAWQIAQRLYQSVSSLNACHIKSELNNKPNNEPSNKPNNELKVCVWVGAGNNGGDGWLVASYLSQLDIHVTVVEVGNANTHDAKLAKQDAKKQDSVTVVGFNQVCDGCNRLVRTADIYIDALFGIGLDRAPSGDYSHAIECINQWADEGQIGVVAIDVPSGLVVDTGEVFDSLAVSAEMTFCLVARKLGLHIKDGQDYTGKIIDIPLIPTVLNQQPIAELYHTAKRIPKRMNNVHKGSFGEALIIGGNQVGGSQGMGGATLLAASSTFAVGVGKLTVACHKAFHPSLIASVPNAMSIDLHDNRGVKRLMKQCDAVAIGMGLGRDEQSRDLFNDYLQAAMSAHTNIIIDADGLYHLADLVQQDNTLEKRLVAYAKQYSICYTPHSGEAARLLDKEVREIEKDRLTSIQSLFDKYGGHWLLKGNGSLVIDGLSGRITVCEAGNAGMSTAGMGDVLSGVVAGLQAQSFLPEECRSLQQAVMIHALAGDRLAKRVGVWATQASDMPHEIGQIMKNLTI